MEPTIDLGLELARLRAAIGLIATRCPGLSDDDGRLLVDLLTPPARELGRPRTLEAPGDAPRLALADDDTDTEG